jgi:UDP-2,4-diacetamido-2,4,6-trideoxy-beta-L-altropyranose hydrolase
VERLHFRVDATRDTGLGHLMRCIALAQAWQDTGRQVTFIGRFSAAIRDRLARERITPIDLPASLTLAGDLAATLAAIPPGALIVLDGYRFDPDYQRALAAHGRLLVVDDMAQWPAYHGRILLNQNLGASDLVYAQAPWRRLLGADYVLLERAFASVPKQTAGARDATRWLVTLGGADSENVTAEIGAALAAAPGSARTVRLVAGPLNPHVTMLDALAAATPRLELIVAPEPMHDALAWADLAVSAAGTTALQLARLGVPMLLIAIADNQVAVGEALDKASAAVYLGRWPAAGAGDIAGAAAALSVDASRRSSLSGKARGLVDGSGAARVCRALVELKEE